MGSENRRQFLAGAGLGLGLGWSAAGRTEGEARDWHSPRLEQQQVPLPRIWGKGPPGRRPGSVCSTPAIECQSA